MKGLRFYRMEILRIYAKRAGFPEKFNLWIIGCVKSVSYTVMINNKPSTSFKAARGLRQGDP